MAKYDIYGIGAALVDTEVKVPDAFLDQYHIEKGVMTLVDQPRQAELLKALDVSGQTLIRKSGGSACNTIVAAANFGANTAFSGKVAQDDDGACFTKDLADVGVSFYGSNADDAVTGKCLVMVTKDAERTMNRVLTLAKKILVNIKISEAPDEIKVTNKIIAGILHKNNIDAIATKKSKFDSNANAPKPIIADPIANPGRPNPFFKPFLKDVNSAALAFIKAIDKNKETYVYPWQMSVLTRLINLLPQFIIDSLIYRSKNRITKFDKN